MDFSVLLGQKKSLNLKIPLIMHKKYYKAPKRSPFAVSTETLTARGTH
jgi:hypothetical protein